ncbi:MAG: aminomethyl-transferring glycine dehydrogenase [Candidatus Methylomirabilota bacterium]|nr:aminomethyl-transferring glycine dehydrogenase subunit GcvPA [candidate division NC10 bacterium]PWB45931.1 MAG: aminomethyl-transferring glycine dehydrogenase [candidate division NC10 bacterium]
MQYIPNTEADCRAMLDAIGVRSSDELFADIPSKLRLKRGLNLAPPLSEAGLRRHMKELAGRNADVEQYASFLGAGAYHHFIPAAVSHLVFRAEFYTAYTPYQPELSQGTLQAIYEYQTLVCQLTGMDVANASMYDGSSALAEAILMAYRINGRPEVVLPVAVHPEYRMVCRTYVSNLGLQLHEVPYTSRGTTDLKRVKAALSDRTCAVVVQSPNFFGVLESLDELAEAAHRAGALLIVAVAEPVSFGIVRSPGEYGTDIVVGEGQGFGNHLNFGGPYLGMFASREAYLRNMPGRLVGQTTDTAGRPGYVLTLATREQHIRRERATSNICTNEGLCALAATVQLALLGRSGLRELALLNLRKAAYAKKAISTLRTCELRFTGATFNEFVVRVKKGTPAQVNRALLAKGIIGGLELGRFYPELSDCLLLCVTEQNSREVIDALCKMMGSGR